MNTLTRVCQGSIQGYKNLITPAPHLEGVFARFGGVATITLIAGTACGYYYSNNAKLASIMVCAVANAVGGIKGSDGGIRFYPGNTPFDGHLNEYLFKAIFIVGGGVLSQIVNAEGMVSRSPLHAGGVALIALQIGAVVAGALKNIVER